MDEILATIRRIIAEDEQPGGPLAASGATARRATAGSAATGTDTAVGAGGLDRGAAAAAAKDTAGNTADEIVELTEAINEDGTVRHLAPIGGTSRIAALRGSSRVLHMPQASQARMLRRRNSEPWAGHGVGWFAALIARTFQK